MIFSVVKDSVAWIVAVRGTSHRMPISPTKASRPTSATFSGPFGVSHQHVGLAAQHDIGGIGLVALMEQGLARHVCRALCREGEEFQLRGFDLGE